VCDSQTDRKRIVKSFREKIKKERKNRKNSSQTNILINTVTPSIFSLQEHEQTIINQIPAVKFGTRELLDYAAATAEIYLKCLTSRI
jgi:hypothetical protein